MTEPDPEPEVTTVQLDEHGRADTELPFVPSRTYTKTEHHKGFPPLTYDFVLPLDMHNISLNTLRVSRTAGSRLRTGSSRPGSSSSSAASWWPPA